MSEDDEKAWLAKRIGHIGSSQIAAIVGANPYAGPADAFLEIMGWAETRTVTRKMRRGSRLEPLILEEYEEDTGRKAILNGRRLFAHAAHAFALATPDAFCTGSPRMVELKKPGTRQLHRWGQQGTDEVPSEYLCQVTWQLACVRSENANGGDLHEVADIAAWIGGIDDDTRVYTVAWNPDLAAALLEAAARFHRNHIVTGTPPDADGSDAYRRIVEHQFPDAKAPKRLATAEEEDLAIELQTTAVVIADATDQADFVKNKLRALIGDAAGIKGPWGSISYNNTKASSYTVNRAAGRSLKPYWKKENK